jgi:hypothetical protein
VDYLGIGLLATDAFDQRRRRTRVDQGNCDEAPAASDHVRRTRGRGNRIVAALDEDVVRAISPIDPTRSCVGTSPVSSTMPL